MPLALTQPAETSSPEKRFMELSPARLVDLAQTVMYGSRNGVDIRAKAAKLAIVEHVDLRFLLQPMMAELEQGELESEIDACYRSLESLPVGSNQESSLRMQLRALQFKQADLIDEALAKRQWLAPGALERALDKVDELLQKYRK